MAIEAHSTDDKHRTKEKDKRGEKKSVKLKMVSGGTG